MKIEICDNPWKAHVLTSFPASFPGSLDVSLIGKSLRDNLWSLNVHDLKKFPAKNDRIDDAPFGGGSGMLLSAITIDKALENIGPDINGMRRIYLSPRGQQLNQIDIQTISESPGVVILCGRYEGVDQRIIDYYNFEEISIGDFVLMGGEVAAMAIIEASVRLIPGVLGDNKSIKNDSFQNNLLEYNQYTRPAIFKNSSVPEVLLKGNHAEIDKYRMEESKRITMKSRNDLWKKYIANEMKTIK